MDAGAGGGVSSSLSSVSESRRPVTAQERQREREEKRRKRQERAKERERKMKEKERREGKQGDLLGGVLLSDNDKSLLQRWTKMMDSRNEKTPNNDSAKSKDCNVKSHRGGAMCDNTQGAQNNKTDKEARKIQSHEQLISQVKPHQPGLFQPPSSHQPSLLYSMSQRKPPADIVVAVSGGIDIMSVTSGFVKNNSLKPHNESNGQSGFNCLGNWSGQQLETRPSQQPQPNRTLQPPPPSFLQPQLQPQTLPDPQPQSQLLPLERFLTKAPTLTTRETNGNVDNNLNSHTNPPTTSTGPMEKLCPVGEKSGPQSTNPLCGALGVTSQPHPSLGFTDTGQQGPSIAPDIHTVTLQLSKSQVCLRFLILSILILLFSLQIVFYLKEAVGIKRVLVFL